MTPTPRFDDSGLISHMQSLAEREEAVLARELTDHRGAPTHALGQRRLVHGVRAVSLRLENAGPIFTLSVAGQGNSPAEDCGQVKVEAWLPSENTLAC
jgi:hypothetical protein